MRSVNDRFTNKISRPVQNNDRAYRGFNFFDPDDEALFRSLGRGDTGQGEDEQSSD